MLCSPRVFRVFGALETSCSRTHLEGPILCSPLLQRRFFPVRSSGIILRSEFRRVLQKYWNTVHDASIFHWYGGAIEPGLRGSRDMLSSSTIRWRAPEYRVKLLCWYIFLACWLDCLTQVYSCYCGPHGRPSLSGDVPASSGTNEGCRTASFISGWGALEC